ncbi:MAG: DUF3793 family protein [Ruminococcus sp.]|nr:DUF3793 family protein [Ruminococcus sp.]
MTESERKEFEKHLAMHSAPTIMGVKCANMFSVKQSDRAVGECIMAMAKDASMCGLKMIQLCKCRERSLVYVYHEKLLSAWLDRSEASDFLADYGYTAEMSLDEKLKLLASRISCDDFPHEVGVFLGYPLEDIKGFIENQGRNCLLCGCWKVYGNAEQAQKTFDMYYRCRAILCDRLKSGLDLFKPFLTFKEKI